VFATKAYLGVASVSPTCSSLVLIRLYYNRKQIGSCYQSDLQENSSFPKLANIE